MVFIIGKFYGSFFFLVGVNGFLRLVFMIDFYLGRFLCVIFLGIYIFWFFRLDLILNVLLNYFIDYRNVL